MKALAMEIFFFLYYVQFNGSNSVPAARNGGCCIIQ